MPARSFLIALTALPLLAGCGGLEPSRPADQERDAARERALSRRMQAACSSQATYDRLKQVAFDEAIRMPNADPANLDILSTHSVVRMENPVVKSRDETLDVTVCEGRFILELPPGAERGFGGERRLTADIEYAAQAAADGSGLVYRIKGAEPIVARLAAFDLKGRTYEAPAAAAEDTQLAVQDVEAPVEREVEERVVERRAPVEVRRDEPAPRPTRTPPPQPRRTAAPEARASASPRPTPRPSPTATRAARANPSFNCRHARTRSEKLVCGSDRLASLDRSMSSLYYSELSNADRETRAELRRSRDRFLAYRERCSSEACVADAYRDRMDEIEDIAAGR